MTSNSHHRNFSENSEIDISTLNSKINLMAGTSFQSTCVNLNEKQNRQWGEEKIRKIVRRSIPEIIKDYSRHQVTIQSLLDLTFNYFQNNRKAILEFIDLITEFQTLAQSPVLFNLFHHKRVDDIVDKQDQYSNFQEMIDELDYHQDEILSSLTAGTKNNYAERVCHYIRRLKIYFLFIESLMGVFSKELEVTKSVAQSNLFCFIIRPDRGQPRCQKVFKEYIDRLRKRIEGFQ